MLVQATHDTIGLNLTSWPDHNIPQTLSPNISHDRFLFCFAKTWRRIFPHAHRGINRFTHPFFLGRVNKLSLSLCIYLSANQIPTSAYHCKMHAFFWGGHDKTGTYIVVFNSNPLPLKRQWRPSPIVSSCILTQLIILIGKVFKFVPVPTFLPHCVCPKTK